MEQTRYKVLMIEDNQLDQMAFKRFVETNKIPYDYMISGSVAEGQRALESEKFDIVITDHSLGDGTAIDVLHSAKDMPIIVVTGAGDEETAVKAWKAGAYDYLVKDINQDYLKAIPRTVKNAIRHHMVEKKLHLLSGAIMSTEDSVFITDMQGEIIFVNKAFCQTYGYKEEEIVGQNGNILWIGRHQSKNTRSVFQTKTIGSKYEVGFYHRRKDDSVFPVSLSRSNIKDAKGDDVAIIGVARDITERILIEDEIRTASVKLKKRNQLQNEVAIMMAETLQKLLADGNIEMADRLISDYLEISKINAEKVKLNPRKFCFASLVSKAVEAFIPLAAQNDIELTNLTSAGELMVEADYDKIAQVLVNLLSRAIKYSPPNGRVCVDVKDAGHELSVEIQDDGPLLERNEIHRIVHRSDWIQEQLRAGREDLALGLRIAKEFVETHGGRLWAESPDTKRNIVCFAVPKSIARREVPMEMSSIGAT
jgi:PAS domain S-box-containing protein